jgi:hypothetical protein
MFYTLDEGHNIVPQKDIKKWAKDFELNRRIEHTLIDDVEISTVFLGLDHSFGNGGPPILFETMVFGGYFDGHQERYASWDEAIAGHKSIINMVVSPNVRSYDDGED